ncbi:MAG: aspartate carbamoyltransferase [Deltaproteobacteria bacterium]|nr:aspartate carbamoyltransferase [Deltaproteobacteria bacterium]
MNHRGLVTIDDLADEEIEEIFRLADGMKPGQEDCPGRSMAAGKIMATLFYEPSTRTRLSFESAMHRLGGAVISCPDMKSSSAAKGESIADTAKVVSSYADVLVVRHYWDGAVQAMAEHAEVPLINAGDGSHEHPTQTLCDLYTLRKEKGELKGLTVAICGDMKHGRTIHSLVYALARFGVNVIILAAKGMELPAYVIDRLDHLYHYSPIAVPSGDLNSVVTSTDAVYLTPTQPHQLALFTQSNPYLEGQLSKAATGLKLDAFYVTRQQKERQTENGSGDDTEYPRIDERFLKIKRFKETVVMHPLPRVDELSPEVDKDRRGIYFKQAAYGVPVRMALIKYLFDAAEAKKPHPVRKSSLLYENPELLGPQCLNGNCVTRKETPSTHPRFEILFTGPGSGLILRCLYCDHQLRVQYIGHATTKRYCSYDLTLEATVREWLKGGELALFDSIKQAEEQSYEPYKTGPQRTIMSSGEVHEAIQKMAQQILNDTPESASLLVLGIRTKGVFIANRLVAELGHEGRNAEAREIEVFGSREENHGAPSIVTLEETEPLNIKGRSVILVDDVIHTGRTVKSALSIIFKSGRPQSVRLAVLVDRGHREVPVKPNYIGKHIPSSEGERVRVKLREVEKDEQDKVIIYSMINPTITRKQTLTG